MTYDKKWDDRYSEPGFAYGTEPNDFLKENAHHIPQKGRVLSIAEGEGRNAVFLAKLGYKVTAVDGSRVGLQKANRLADENGVTLNTVVADFNNFAIHEGEWDGIILIWVHPSSLERAKLYRDCAKGLRKGGVMIIEAYSKRQLEHRTGGPGEADRLPSLDEMKQALGDLEFVVVEDRVREVHEGRFHNGESAVIEVVARCT